MDSTNLYNGVRAEPKFLRDPTSLESISSGISRLSSYVTSNLPKRKSSIPTNSPFDPHYYQQHLLQEQVLINEEQQKEEEEENDMKDFDIITFSCFDKLDENISCLILGYHDGFQLWDITNPDNVHELCSIRDKQVFGTVSFIHIIKKINEKPLLAIISETTIKEQPLPSNSNDTTLPSQHKRMNSNTSTSSTATTTKKNSNLIIYSLQSQSIVKELKDFNDEEDDTTVVTCIKSNHKVIVLGCLSRHKSSIHLLSISDFKPFSVPLTDIYHDSITGPVFTLGPRFIAYATNTAVLNSDPVMTSLTNKSLSYTGFGVLQGDKDVKGAAKDIAKEVVSGMKTLGEFGYNTFTNYFGNQQPPPSNDYISHSSPNNSNRRPSSQSPRSFLQQQQQEQPPLENTNKKMIPSGMIMIRDILKLPTIPTRNLSSSIIAHFRPHTHSVTCLTFNQPGTLLMSASKQGHTFHIFSILINSTHGNASHLYSLSRGITDAQVVDCQFSIDSTWCAISTARGTTHVYAINPYGGKPEISGHVHGKVNNPSFYPFLNNKSKSKSTSLNSVVRIKQRRKMPGSTTTVQQEDFNNKYAMGYYGPTPPHYIPPTIIPPVVNRTNKEPRAKITSMFVTTTKSPYLVNNSSIKNTILNNNVSVNTPSTIKQQATTMLSSFGSSMSQLPYTTTNTTNQQKTVSKWNDKNDTLMFGFDEEYDDSTKMMNDEIGYQDLYSFHPDGILTLHRCWVAKTVVKKRENGRSVEKLDLSLKEEDVAEWRVARNSEWDQVKLTLPTTKEEEEPTKKKGKKQKMGKQKKLWLSNAEITTYAILPDDPALWTHHQFSFQTFKETKDLQRILNAGLIPSTETMIMLKGMPEPVSSRIDRVKKTTTRIANNNQEENMDDALAELEDNISKAMQTSFSPSSNSLNSSPAAASLKWLSSSANAAGVPSPSPSSMNNRSFIEKNSSVSFEDAYLIHMGSGPSPEPSMNNHHDMMQNSSLIQFDDDDDDNNHSVQEAEEDIIRLEEEEEDEDITSKQTDVYSPDGDNEVAYPSESIFGELRDKSYQNRDGSSDNESSW